MFGLSVKTGTTYPVQISNRATNVKNEIFVDYPRHSRDVTG
jgi:hypothetical protein